jgi:hypothetical protein
MDMNRGKHENKRNFRKKKQNKAALEMSIKPYGITSNGIHSADKLSKQLTKPTEKPAVLRQQQAISRVGTTETERSSVALFPSSTPLSANQPK